MIPEVFDLVRWELVPVRKEVNLHQYRCVANKLDREKTDTVGRLWCVGHHCFQFWPWREHSHPILQISKETAREVKEFVSASQKQGLQRKFKIQLPWIQRQDCPTRAPHNIALRLPSALYWRALSTRCDSHIRLLILFTVTLSFSLLIGLPGALMREKLKNL